MGFFNFDWFQKKFFMPLIVSDLNLTLKPNEIKKCLSVSH